MNSVSNLEVPTTAQAASNSGHSGLVTSQTPNAEPELLSLQTMWGFGMFWIIGGAAVLRGLAKAFPSRIAEVCSTQLQHGVWQGLHLYDVVWPLILVLLGADLRLLIAQRRGGGVGDGRTYAMAAIRALLLFLIGMVTQGNLLAFSLSRFHPFSSILHGAAAGYLIAAVVMLKLRWKMQAAAVGAGLLAYWALLMLIPVPGFGAGVLTPEGNAASYVDRLLLGSLQYGSNTWFLTYLSFGACVVLGGLGGEILLAEQPAGTKVLSLCGAGVGLASAGLLWSIWLPIIRPIWTSSYVLVCCGVSLVCMGVLHGLVDIGGFQRWTFGFRVIGVNAAVAYVATTLFDFRHIGNIFVGDLLSRVGLWAECLEASATFVVIWLVLFWMYRTKSFVRL